MRLRRNSATAATITTINAAAMAMCVVVGRPSPGGCGTEVGDGEAAAARPTAKCVVAYELP